MYKFDQFDRLYLRTSDNTFVKLDGTIVPIRDED